jgi:hypothetical protein
VNGAKYGKFGDSKKTEANAWKRAARLEGTER